MTAATVLYCTVLASAAQCQSAVLLSVASRVDTWVDTRKKSREFHAKRVPNFAKKSYLFREISCFVKLALKCKSQFRMFRISRNKTFNKRNEATLQHIFYGTTVMAHF